MIMIENLSKVNDVRMKVNRKHHSRKHDGGIGGKFAIMDSLEYLLT